MKANQLYEEWLTENPVPENERLKFSNQWIKELQQGILYQFKETKQKVFHQKERSSRALARLLEKCLASKKIFYRQIRYRPASYKRQPDATS